MQREFEKRSEMPYIIGRAGSLSDPPAVHFGIPAKKLVDECADSTCLELIRRVQVLEMGQ